MAVSPSPSLYRSARRSVILAASLLAVALSTAQLNKAPAPSKGPRALGLVEITPSGRARLIPIVIMINGEFYDAGSYKASPVPMALESQTVYEGEKTGASVGFFTVSGALHGPNNTWVGDGKWQLPEDLAPKKKEAPKPKRNEDDDDGPPKLKRPEAKKPADSSAPQPAPASSAPPAAPAPGNTP